MKKLSFALLLVASSATAQRASDPGFARLPGPTLRIADSLRIDTRAAKLENPLTVFPGPKGGLIVYSQWRAVTAFDSLGRRIWSKGDERSSERREVAEVTAFGWRGNEMWVSDAAWSQIALLDQYGNVTKSLELPSWVRPTFSNRKAFPVFESMSVLSLYDDGHMLVMPRGDNLSAAAKDFDENARYLVRINEDGIIQRTVAKFPSSSVLAKDSEGQFRYQNPLNQWLFRAAPDGKRVIVVGVDTLAPRTDTVVVRALGEKGDTVFVKKFAYPALSFSETQIDSVGRSMWGNDTDYRERRTKLLPRRAPTVVSVAMDADKSVWLTLRGNATSRSVVGIDAAGNFIGKFELPARRVVKAANLGRVWIGEANNSVRGDLVRYRLIK